MFAVRPICVQDSIFKMSSESPDEAIVGTNVDLLSASSLRNWSEDIVIRKSEDISQSNMKTNQWHVSDFELTSDTPYITLNGQLWGVHCWLCVMHSPVAIG